MEIKNVYEWIKMQQDRKRTLLVMKLPLTAKQIGSKFRMNSAICSRTLNDFTVRGLAKCLNPKARNSRLYHLTDLGKQCQQLLRKELNLPEENIEIPDTDWGLYGWMCFSHRSAVIKSITEPMQPSNMKRQIRRRNPDAKISANNIRDIIRLFEEKGVVQKVFVKKKAHPRYELTETGKQLQKILIKQKSCM